MTFLIAGVVVAGLVAGAYARAFAAGFAEDPGDHREEARRALAAALRTPPVPRPPYVIEAVTAVAAGLVAWRVAGGWLLAAWLYGTAAGAALAAIDRRTWRLPDAVTLPSYPIVLALLAPSGRWPAALACGAAFVAVYGLLWFARPTGIGLGDVKLAGLIGLLTGAAGVQAAVVAGFAGYALGAVYAVGLLVTGRGTRTSEFPLGPFMVAGALAGVVLPVQG
ncbi:prepilin peptidase [Microbispora sp. RL4-1S]|uniref:Prepilin peptidase n=1 Tax=Microbispora oryzae TaxID=2806554 RepID=A0A940WQK9_9ACTN|nr:A24 family peptidase [Microbispora oryzae]MBP2705705.1 prepilin peptidase [Microbispora oryzae]